MVESVRSTVWFDGLYWEVTIPPGWAHRRGRRDLFRAPDATRLWISSTRVNPDNPTHGAPPTLSPAQREVFASAASDASMAAALAVDPGKLTPSELAQVMDEQLRTASARQTAAAKTLTRRVAGSLVGFTHPSESALEGGWTGWFESDPWKFYVGYRFRKPEGDEEAALSILASMRFY